MSEASSLSTRLRLALDERDLSQAKLAARTQIGASTLNKIINGKRPANARELGAIAHELGLDLLDLLGVADALAEREQLAQAAILRAEQSERELVAAQAAQASAGKRVAAFEAKLQVADQGRRANERTIAKLSNQLEAAQAELERLSEPVWQREPPPPERPFEPSLVVLDHDSPARAKANLYGGIAGGVAKALTSWFVFNHANKPIDGKR